MYAISGNEKLPPNMCTTDLEFGIETSDEILVWMSPAIVSIEIKGVNIGWSKRGRIAKFWAAFPLLSPVQGVHATRIAQFLGLPPNLNRPKRILSWSITNQERGKRNKERPRRGIEDPERENKRDRDWKYRFLELFFLSPFQFPLLSSLFLSVSPFPRKVVPQVSTVCVSLHPTTLCGPGQTCRSKVFAKWVHSVKQGPQMKS